MALLEAGLFIRSHTDMGLLSDADSKTKDIVHGAEDPKGSNLSDEGGF